AGDFATIVVNFDDNIGVTDATLYYRKQGITTWTSVDILTTNFDLETTPGINQTWEYYVVIDDAAGNGPVGKPSINGSTFYTITATYEEEPNGDEIIHTVFIEESSTTDCKFCPYMADKIEALSESEDYQFHYVNLVSDVNSIADERVTEYNLYGNPTLFIDGGFKVFVGKDTPLSDIKKAIRDAEARDAAQILINISSEYRNDTETIKTELVITNFDTSIYTGNLRVYLVEKISRWNDYNGSKYKNAFLAYRFNTDIEIPAQDAINFSDSFAVGDLDPENLRLIAVVFEEDTHQGYARPPDQNPFDAHYADASAAAEVVEGGNLPPAVGINKPLQGKMYLRGRLILNFYYNNFGSLRNTFVLGPMTFVAIAEDDSAITKVEFFVDNELVYNDTEAPYEYTPETQLLRTPAIIPRKTTMQVIAYDNQGKTSLAFIEFIAFRVFPR
ncbi:MAG: hypothetical protein KKC68_07945, partial [Candidatus Thermoplasmatota archaeon]|nr:hypothetical protein [Candidatus Thermoplasmatota archaeon]